MNYRYTKLPVTIEAFQMTEARRQDNSLWPQWLHDAWNKMPTDTGALHPMHPHRSDGTDMLIIKTLEGDQLVSWDDYIIRGVQGEIYPCKPDIFKATYVEETGDQ